MVRKRTRTSRKHYESEDNDTDSDYALEDVSLQPSPRKYSLRQRKKAVFIDECDYEDDDEILPIPPTKAPSDDEDFEVEKELALQKDSETNSCYAGSINEFIDPAEDPNGLIDFEDMIRADIVVNKHRIDYDNIINGTEIKVQVNGKETMPSKSKRGRKPKKMPEYEVDSSVLEPESEDPVDEDDDDYNPNIDLPGSVPKLQQSEYSVDRTTTNPEEEPIKQPNGADNSLLLTSGRMENVSGDSPDTTQESVIKFNDNYVHKLIHLNGGVVLEKDKSASEESKDDTEKSNVEYEDEDDDVIFVEDKRSEIIVLDD